MEKIMRALCRAVIDVSKYFDWRKDARRAIFVLGDANKLDRFQSIHDRDEVTKEYERLANETDGRPYIYTTGIANFSLILQEILCDSLNPPVINKPDANGAGCSKVCDEFDTIMSTVNTLAGIVMKAMDACCPGSSAGSSASHSGCKCKK